MKTVNKNKVARSFKRGQKTYDSNARIQNYVSRKLIDMLAAYPQICYENVFEIGCCTGNLTELLLKQFAVKRLYLNDLVPSFFEDVVKRVRGIRPVEIEPLFGDAEELRFPEKLDLVISSATFQWFEDIDRLFAKVAGSLNKKGFLAFSIFGPGTLCEFRKITGIGLDYSAIGLLLDMLEERFNIEEEQTVKDQIFFANPREVLKHLQATGVGGVQEHRWTPSSLRSFEKEYYDRFGSVSGVPVTYISSYIIASKK